MLCRVQTKTVVQCVEYYYIQKKMIQFDCGRAPVPEKRVKRELDEADRTEAKVTCSPRRKPSHRPTPELKRKTKSYRRESIPKSSANASSKRTPELPGSRKGQGCFPCRECERVFDKIKSRNAHMKWHRLQDHVEPTVRARGPVEPFQLEEKEGELGAGIGPLRGQPVGTGTSSPVASPLATPKHPSASLAPSLSPPGSPACRHESHYATSRQGTHSHLTTVKALSAVPEALFSLGP